MDILDVANRVDAFWGLRLRGKEIGRASGWYRVLIYDAFELVATIDGASVRLEVMGVEPEPGAVMSDSVSLPDLSGALEQFDDALRAALPAAYVAAYDSWVAQDDEGGMAGRRLSPQERRALVEAQSTETPVPAGPTVDRTEIVSILEHRFGDRVHVTPDGSDNRVDAVLDGFFPIVVERDAQYGSLTAALLLGARAIVTVFGERLIARHPDERSLRDLLDLIDRWVGLRLS